MAEELINFDLPSDQSSIIKVIGVGGGGSNAVNYMFRQGIRDVDFVVCNTDAQSLQNSPVSVKIQLGESLTEGRGAGNKPDIGRQAAIENLDDVLDVLSRNTKMVFITAGMGGGTGTGAAPVIAKASRELGILTVGIVTIPFRFEGQQRIKQAIEGINELKQHVDSLLVINNEKLREICGDLKLSEAFAKTDNVLATAAKGIAEIITVHGYVNVDFADVETVMAESGVAIMGTGIAEGENRAINAIKQALTSPLLNNNSITGAKNILLNITSGVEEISMDEVGEVTDYVTREVESNANIIWGTGYDGNLGKSVSVTIIATGFETNNIPEMSFDEKVADKINLEEESKRKAEEIAFEIKNKKSGKQIEDEPGIFQRSIEFEISPAEMTSRGGKLSKGSLQGVKKEIKENKTYKDGSYSSCNKINIEELENVPAFKRKNINIDVEDNSTSTDVSKYTLSDDEENKIKLNPNNMYLHDNVD